MFVSGQMPICPYVRLLQSHVQWQQVYKHVLFNILPVNETLQFSVNNFQDQDYL